MDSAWLRFMKGKAVSTTYGPASDSGHIHHDPDHQVREIWGDPNSIMQVNPEQLRYMQAQAQCAPPPVTKDSVVAEVGKTVCGPREEAYGGPEDNFQRIANHWNVFLTNRFGVKVGMTAADVSAMMILLKVARLEYKIDHHDSWVDAGGYSVCGAVCAANP